MLRRFADARVRAELDKTSAARDEYRHLARLFATRLRAARAANVALAADLAAERARTQETTGRCGQSLDSWSRSSPLICALPAGHAGWHRDDNRAEWGPITEVTKP